MNNFRNYYLLGCAFISASLLTPVSAQAVSFNPINGKLIITEDADWNMGTFTNVNNNSNPPDPNNRPPGNNQIQLDPSINTPFNHIWVALSGRGTVARIDTDFTDPDGRVTLADSVAGNGAVFGEYYSAPDFRGRNPSRTTVDRNGDVWVGNRNEFGSDALGGSVAKILANPSGITSSGNWNGSNFDVLSWSNAGGVDNNGGTDTAVDTAIEYFVRTPGTANRTLAVDENNDLWVGGYSNKLHAKIDGTTGEVVPDTTRTINPGGYGGLIDGNGILWSSGWASNQIARYDTVTDALAFATTGGGSYGLGIDTEGNIWNTHLSTTVTKLDPLGNIIFTKNYGGQSGGRGVAVTPIDNHAWIANSFGNTVTRLDEDGNVVAVITVENVPTGVAVDSNGKVWVTNFSSNSVSRINPETNLVDLTVELGPGATPYNYSDMTGTGFFTSNPSGMWRTVTDSRISNQQWFDISWNTEDEAYIPDEANIIIQVRASDSETDLINQPYMTYNSGDPLNLFGRYIDIKAILSRGTKADSESPVLSNILITGATTDGGNGTKVPEPSGILALIGISIASLFRFRCRH